QVEGVRPERGRRGTERVGPLGRRDAAARGGCGTMQGTHPTMQEAVMKRFIFVAGLAIGFVIGSRMGRGPYESLERTAHRVAEDPEVQRRAAQVVATAAQAPAVAWGGQAWPRRPARAGDRRRGRRAQGARREGLGPAPGGPALGGPLGRGAPRGAVSFACAPRRWTSGSSATRCA